MRKIVLVFLLGVMHCVVLSQNSGLTTTQIEEMKENAKKVALNVYASINLIANLSPDPSNNNDISQIRTDLISFFEGKKVQVYNDLIEGSKYKDIESYLTSIASVFSKYPGEISIGQNVQVSNVYYDDKGFYVVIVSAIVSVEGLDNNKRSIDKKNSLSIFLKFPVTNNVYETPKIYWIMDTRDDKREQFSSVEIVQNSSVSSNTAQISELQTRLNQSQDIMNRMKQETERIKKEYETKIANLQTEEERLLRMEKRLTNSEVLINQQQTDLQKKQDEIDRQRKLINEQQIALNKEKQKVESTKKKVDSDRYNQYNLRRVFDIGMGVGYNQGTISDNINGVNAGMLDLSPQLRAMLGYRFDMRLNTRRESKLNRGSVMGVFLNYSLNSTNNIIQTIDLQGLSIPDDRKESIFNRSLDIEFGFLFRELYRLSAGFGSMNGYRYYISTMGFKIPFGRSVTWEFGTSVLFGQDYVNAQINPYTSLSFQLNDKIASSYKNDHFEEVSVVRFSSDLLYAYNHEADYSEIQPNMNFYWGIKTSDVYNLGLAVGAGNFSGKFTEALVKSHSLVYDSIFTNYNPYFHVDLGMYFHEKYRFSMGGGRLFLENKEAVPLYSFSLGASYNLYNRLVLWNFDVSAKYFDGNFNKHIFTASTGLCFRFDVFR
jgi:hypothetical protein